MPATKRSSNHAGMPLLNAMPSVDSATSTTPQRAAAPGRSGRTKPIIAPIR